MSIQIPELIETWRIARTIGWSTKKTTTFLAKQGLAGKVKGWRDTMVIRTQFEATMPHIYRLFVEKYEAGELCSRRGGNRSKTTIESHKFHL